MPAGRPTKYEPEFCERAREFLAQGYSLAAFAGSIGVSYSTVRLWEQEHPEFSAAVKDGRAGATLWWENRARALAQGGEGNATTVIFGLKNRAPEEWKDKRETELSGRVEYANMTEEEIDARLAKLMGGDEPPDAAD
jgi:transcriptional regulator with XRE-family HTH domain